MEISLQRRHSLIVEDGAFSHIFLYFFLEIFNIKGHKNRVTGLTVTAILLNGWILPIGGVSAVEGLLSTAPTLSSLYHTIIHFHDLSYKWTFLGILRASSYSQI